MSTGNTHNTPKSEYRAFETISVAVKDKMPRRARMYLEVQQRVGHGIVSFNLDDFPEDDSDLHEIYRLSEVDKKLLPANGRILVAANDASSSDFLNDYEMTLKDKQVVAIEGHPWTAPPKAPGKKPKRKALEAEARKHVLQTCKRIITMLKRSKVYHLNGDGPKIVISFSPNRRRSRGGQSGVSFALNHYLKPGEVQLREYATYAKDPDIGSCNADWKTVIACVVCHEIAHWAQYSGCVKLPHGMDYKKPHGLGFQEIYRYLRTRIAPCNK